MKRKTSPCTAPDGEVPEGQCAAARPQSKLEVLQARCRQLEDERRQLAAIVEGSRDAIWSWTPDGTIVRWNAAAERLFGYAADEIVGQSLLKLVPPERLSLAREAIRKLGQGAWYGQYETSRLRKDGQSVDVELTVSPIIDGNGKVAGASTVCRDISERKRFELSLAKRMGALATLYRFTERLQVVDSLADIYEAALDAIVNALGCDRGSILLFDSSRVMRFAAWRGLSEQYRAAVDGHSPWTADVVDPQPIYVQDIDLSNESESLKATVRGEGIRALAFIPLVTKGRLIGKFMTYYQAAHAFAEDEISLAVTIARQLASAIARQTAEAELRESEQRFRLMSEQAPVMIWMSDPECRCVHLNRMLREFWGVGDSDLAGFDWQDTMHPEDAPEIGRLMMGALAKRGAVTIKGRYRDAAGRYRVLQTDARPRFSGKGEFLGMIGVNVDVTERELAERALRESEERFRLAVEAAPSGMVMTNHEGRIVLVNAHSEKLFGYSREEMVGQKIELVVPQRFQEHHPKYRNTYRHRPSARPMGAGRDLFARRKDGTEVPVEIGLSPIETAEGMMALAAVVDISSRKRAESQRELLLAELNHRVKNTLAVVQSIAYQTFRDTIAPAEARKAFEGRLIALSLAHNLLTQTNWESASLDELATFTLDAKGANTDRIELSGSPVLLSPREALSIAMALHELYTNAIKHGALSNDSGRIVLNWTLSGDPLPRLGIKWQESDGPPTSPPKHRGFGSLLLERTLARDLDAQVTLSFGRAGLSCSMDVPLSRNERTTP